MFQFNEKNSLRLAYNTAHRIAHLFESSLDFLLPIGYTNKVGYYHTYEGRYEKGRFGDKFIPENKVNFGLKVNFHNGLRAKLAAHYVDEVDWIAPLWQKEYSYAEQANESHVDPYFLINAWVDFSFYHDKIELSLTMFNMNNMHCQWRPEKPDTNIEQKFIGELSIKL